MIIFGSKAVHLKSEQTDTVVCHSCGKRGSLSINIFGKHAHFFWIPFFPIGKTGVSQCQHCKNVLRLNEMPQALKDEYKALAKETGYKFWQYAGIIIFLLLFGPTLLYLITALF